MVGRPEELHGLNQFLESILGSLRAAEPIKNYSSQEASLKLSVVRVRIWAHEKGTILGEKLPLQGILCLTCVFLDDHIQSPW